MEVLTQPFALKERGGSSCSVAASRKITGQLHKSSTGSYVLPLTGPGDEHKGGGEV